MSSNFLRYAWAAEWAEDAESEREVDGSDRDCQDGIRALRDAIDTLRILAADGHDPLVILIRHHIEDGYAQADFKIGHPAPTHFDDRCAVPKRFRAMWDRVNA